METVNIAAISERRRFPAISPVRAVVVALCFLGFFSGEATAEAADRSYGIGQKKLTLVDTTRAIKSSGDFPGSDHRRIDLILWYPVGAAPDGDMGGEVIAQGSPWPLVVYAHGTMGYPDNATHFVGDLVRRGYVVAAPTFPLTSRKSFTGIGFPEMSDTPNQPGDVSFVIEQLLADETFGPLIDGQKIGCVGHSLGAITCYFASFGAQTRDARIDASALIGAGDPVQAALASDFGFDGVAHAPAAVPVLFLSGDHDVFAGLGGRPYAAYSRLESPKYELMIKGGNHVWFRDGNQRPADGKNPDCLFFERSAPDMVVPGCDKRGGLVTPELQQRITRESLAAFFDGYLKQDMDALALLGRLPEKYDETELRFED